MANRTERSAETREDNTRRKPWTPPGTNTDGYERR